MATYQGDVYQHMQRSSGKEEIPTKHCISADTVNKMQVRKEKKGAMNNGKDRSCTDQIATLRIIVELSIEWDSSVYINFVDYEKAFDSLDRDKL